MKYLLYIYKLSRFKDSYFELYKIYLYNHRLINYILLIITNMILLMLFLYKGTDSPILIIESEIPNWHNPVVIYRVYHENGDIYYPNYYYEIDDVNNVDIPVLTSSELQALDDLISSPDSKYNYQFNPSIDNIQDNSFFLYKMILENVNKVELENDKIGTINIIIDTYTIDDSVFIIYEFNNIINNCITQEQLIKESLKCVKDVIMDDVSIDIYIANLSKDRTISPYIISLFRIALKTNYELQQFNYDINFHYDEIYNIYIKYCGRY